MPTIIGKLRFDLGEHRGSLCVSVTPAHSKKHGAYLLSVDLFQPLLEHSEPVLFQEKQPSSKFGEASAYDIRVIRRQECGKSGVPRPVILNWPSPYHVNEGSDELGGGVVVLLRFLLCAFAAVRAPGSSYSGRQGPEDAIS